MKPSKGRKVPRATSVTLAGAHQGIARPAAVLDALARASSDGLRMIDITKGIGLGKATVHRLLAGLQSCRLVEQDLQSGRYFIGSRVLAWGTAAGDRFGLARCSDAALRRLAEVTLDTVYLTGRDGDEAVCLARREGDHPIRTLTLNVGDRRPLGVSAGGLALLAALPDGDVARILDLQTRSKTRLPFDQITLRRKIDETRRQGFAFYDAPVIHGLEVVTGMAAVALVIRQAGRPAAALSVAAITARLDPSRRKSIVEKLRDEVAIIEAFISPVADRSDMAHP